MLLEAEQDALFSWMARGAQKFFEIGSLGPIPDAIAKASKEYLKEQDTVSQWIDGVCEVGNMNDTIKQSDLFDLYSFWCESEEIRKMKKKEFLEK